VFVRSIRTPKYTAFKLPDMEPRGNARWAFDEAVRHTECHWCDAAQGEPCVKKGHPIGTIHIQRLRMYRKFIGTEEYQLRHGGSTLVGVRLDKEGAL
jgi:hypothetical protein